MNIYNINYVGLYSKAGLLKLWVETSFETVKCNFGVAKQTGLTNQIQKFL